MKLKENTVLRLPLHVLLFFAAFKLNALGGIAQIGVGTTAPHPSAMLHISPGAGNNKGLILPKVTSGSRVVLDSTQNIAHGLIFFDTDLQKFYYFHASPKQWYELDHDWIRKDIAGASPVVGTHIYSGVPGNVGIGTAANINPGSKLTVVGNLAVGSSTYTQDSVAPANGATFGTFVGIGTRNQPPGVLLHVKGNTRTQGNATVTGDVTANRFFGEGAVHPGLISMWSGNPGTAFPGGLGIGDYEGWALCDGSNGTPDLRGRFVVGLSNSDLNNYSYVNAERNLAQYNTIGNNGGERTHALTVSEMPSHSHGGSTTTDGNHEHSMRSAAGACGTISVGPSQIRLDGNCNSNYDNSTTGNMDFGGSHSHSINAEGGGTAHENRPPYYVLAYIIKLP
jgi:microcystin-dependent protein